MVSTLLLFAKYPRAGLAKTRLIPALGAAGAARLAEAFMLDFLERLAREEFGADVRRVLCFDPPDAADDFRALLAREKPGADLPQALAAREKGAGGFTLVPQAAGNLGERLAAALEHASGGPAIFVGADAPDLPLAEIAAAIQHAREGRAYLQRACDGGYVLLALPAGATRDVFSAITWSAATTAAQQAERIRAAKLELVESAQVWPDVDEPADLPSLKARLLKNPALAPRTLAVLRAVL